MYLMITLLLCGIIWDIVVAATGTGGAGGGGGGGTADSFAPRVLTAISVLVFSFLSLVMKHRVAANIMKIDSLQENKLLWIDKFLKIKRKSKKMVSKSWTKKKLIIMNFLVLLFLLMPLILGEAIGGNLAPYVYDREFAWVGICLRPLAWPATIIVAKFSIFWNKKRYLELI